MKQSSTIALMGILILTTLLSGATPAAHAIPTELIQNGGFESGNLSPWQTWDGGSYVQAGNVRAGTYAASVINGAFETVTFEQSIEAPAPVGPSDTWTMSTYIVSDPTALSAIIRLANSTSNTKLALFYWISTNTDAPPVSNSTLGPGQDNLVVFEFLNQPTGVWIDFARNVTSDVVTSGLDPATLSYAPTNVADDTFAIRIGYENNATSRRVCFDSISLAKSFPPAVQVTVTSSPATGSGFVTADSTPIITPQTFNWVPGETHTLSANSPVPLNSTAQYAWASWSDGGARTHTITVSGTPTLYTANYAVVILPPPPTQRTITVTTSPRGLDSPTGAGTYWTGTKIRIAVSPVYGWVFQKWQRDNADYTTQMSFFYTVEAAHTFAAVFRASVTRQIIVNTSPSIGGRGIGSGTYLEGTAAMIAVAPAPGYTFVKWQRDGVDFPATVAFGYTVEAAHTFTAVLQGKPATIGVATSPQGLDSPRGAGAYLPGTVITVSVGTVSGYVFQQWQRDNQYYSSRSSFQYTVDAAHTFTAVFQQVPQYVTITVTTSPPGLGTPRGGGTCLKGSVITVSVGSVAGYRFQRWLRDGVFYTSAPSFSYLVDGAHTFTAVYQRA